MLSKCLSGLDAAHASYTYAVNAVGSALTRSAALLASACTPQQVWQRCGEVDACYRRRRRRCRACSWLCCAALALAGRRALLSCDSGVGDTNAAVAGRVPAQRAKHATDCTAWPGTQRLPGLGQQAACCSASTAPAPACTQEAVAGWQCQLDDALTKQCCTWRSTI